MDSELFNTIVIFLPWVITLASAIVAATPTPTDNLWLSRFYKIIEVLALNVGKAKQ